MGELLSGFRGPPPARRPRLPPEGRLPLRLEPYGWMDYAVLCSDISRRKDCVIVERFWIRGDRDEWDWRLRLRAAGDQYYTLPEPVRRDLERLEEKLRGCVDFTQWISMLVFVECHADLCFVKAGDVLIAASRGKVMEFARELRRLTA